MRLLLDTHLLLWLSLDDPKCPAQARKWVADTENEVFFSAASIWEVAILNSRKPPRFPFTAADLRTSLLESGYAELPVSAHHASLVETLPRRLGKTVEIGDRASVKLSAEELRTFDASTKWADIP